MARSNDAPRGAPRPEPTRAEPTRSHPDGTNSPGRELRARGQRTMGRLLEAGIAVFAARGYHAARVDDIVKVARTSHGTFYLYFGGKEDLFRALAADVAADMMELADSLPPLANDGAGVRALRDWLTGFSDLYERSGPVIRAWTEAEIGGSEFGRLGTEVLAGFARVLAARIRDAAPADLDPQVAALALVAMIERANYFVLAGQVDVDRTAMLTTLTEVMHRSLFGLDGRI